jgi:hypothetical protein
MNLKKTLKMFVHHLFSENKELEKISEAMVEMEKCFNLSKDEEYSGEIDPRDGP